MKRFIFALLLCAPSLLATTIGSDTGVLRVYGQQSINNGDLVAGFAALQGGFLVNGTSAVWVFSSFFPVSGILDFNNNTVALQRDLIVTNTATIPRLGGIYGNGYQFSLAQTTTWIPANNAASSIIYSNLYFNLTNDTTINSAKITFTGLNVIDGNGYQLSLNLTSTLLIASQSSLQLKNVRIIGLGAQNIQCVDSSSTLTLEDVHWIQDLSFTFSLGRIDLFGNCLLSGPNTIFTYQTSQPFTIQSQATLTLDNMLTFSYAPTTANKNLIVFADNTATLDLEGATFAATATGAQLTVGTLVVGRSSSCSSGAVTNGQAIVFGDGANSANDLQVQIKPAATLNLTSGILLYNNV